MSRGVSIVMNQAKLADAIRDFGSPFIKEHDKALYLDPLISLFDGLSLDLSHYFGFEIHLSKQETAPDFLICLHQFVQLRNLFNNQIEHLREGKKHLGALMELNLVADAWEGKWSSSIKNLWLELDSHDIQKQTVDFSIFFAPASGAHGLEIVLIIEDLYFRLMGDPITKGVLKNFLECFRKLPPTGLISQIGMMKSRRVSGLRLFIQDLPNVSDYLKSLNYNYTEHETFKRLLELGKNWDARVDLDVDIHENLSDKIGLEYYFKDEKSARGFGLECVDLGFVEKSLFDGIHEFPKPEWKLQFEPYTAWFSHFKIAFAPEIDPVCKAYVGLKRIL